MRKKSIELSKHYFYVLKYRRRKEYNEYVKLGGSVKTGYDIYTDMIEKVKNEILYSYYDIQDSNKMSFKDLYIWYKERYNKDMNQSISYFYGVFQKLPYGYSHYKTYDKIVTVNKILKKYIKENNVLVKS